MEDIADTYTHAGSLINCSLLRVYSTLNTQVEEKIDFYGSEYEM
jgi:hypothetical protein